MANRKQLAILKQGVEVWNRWREENPGVWPDLRRAELTWADLRGVDLGGVDLGGAALAWANLRDTDLGRADLGNAGLGGADLGNASLRDANFLGADLSEARLMGADLSRARLIGAHLVGADLVGADLCEADLSRAHLIRAHFSMADLDFMVISLADLGVAGLGVADFTGARVGGTVFGDLDLSLVKGLETVRHSGPSIIGIDTIYKSHGKIPEAFLRGCGVPDNFIEYVGSLTGKAFEYYSCFISYSTKDESFAQRLHNDLQGQGVRCWFAPEDMKIGDKIRDRIDQSIRIHDKLMIVLSEHSINSSWVEAEVETALEEEDKRKQTVLFPIRLDEAVMQTGQAWAAHIRRTRHIGDFTEWEHHPSYQQAFTRLLRDLKASEA
jgi:uncharacterized protein YjbI with pentapeptide repeats